MIAVVGSINRDLVLIVEAAPLPGETVLAIDHAVFDGGKGANQAVAASRLGAKVSFIGKVGRDEGGRSAIDAIALAGVATDHVGVVDTTTGLAVIILDRSGENRIVVGAGANATLSGEDIAAATDTLGAAGVTLLQLEIPDAAVMAAARLAGGRVVLNPAPARPLPARLLENVDVLVPNRGELEALTGSAEPASATELGVPAVVVTLGDQGAALVVEGSVVTFPSPPVEVVDTTGAGDAFCGALGAALDQGLSLPEAVALAVHAGALAVTGRGARTALPTLEELRRLLA